MPSHSGGTSSVTSHKLDKMNLLFYSSGMAFLLIPIWIYYNLPIFLSRTTTKAVQKEDESLHLLLFHKRNCPLCAEYHCLRHSFFDLSSYIDRVAYKTSCRHMYRYCVVQTVHASHSSLRMDPIGVSGLVLCHSLSVLLN